MKPLSVRPKGLTEEEYQLEKALFLGYQKPLPNRRERRSLIFAKKAGNNRKKTKCRSKYPGHKF